MPGVSSGGVSNKNSTPKVLAHYDVTKTRHATIEILPPAFLAYFAYLENDLF